MAAPPHDRPAGLRVLGRLALLAGLVALSAAATLRLITQARAEVASDYSTLSDRIAVAPDLDPAVADYAKNRGDFWLRSSIPPKLDLAAAEYRRAVELNPYEAFHWNDWGQVCWRQGRIEEAERAFALADSLDPNNYVIQRDIGDFYLSRQQPAAAAPHHARAIRANPSLARGIYSVYWTLDPSPVRTARSLLGDDPKLLRRYLLDCLAWVSPEEAGQLWEELSQQESALDAGSYAAYFDFLIARKLYGAARALWGEVARNFYRQTWDSGRDLLWNGRFSLPLVFAGGLEWRIDQRLPNGVQAVVSAAKGSAKSNSLWLHFSGRENVVFSHVRHFFFVEPGQTYRLSYRANALDLTTDKGPYVRVTVYGNPPVRKSGRMAAGTGSWEVEDEFTVPPDGQWAELTIRRDASAKLGNKIKGDVWYDHFALEPKTESTSGTLHP